MQSRYIAKTRLTFRFETLLMDLDLHDILTALQAAARSIGAEVTSPWFYLQFGLVLAGAGIAFATSCCGCCSKASAPSCS